MNLFCIRIFKKQPSKIHRARGHLMEDMPVSRKFGSLFCHLLSQRKIGRSVFPFVALNVYRKGRFFWRELKQSSNVLNPVFGNDSQLLTQGLLMIRMWTYGMFNGLGTVIAGSQSILCPAVTWLWISDISGPQFSRLSDLSRRCQIIGNIPFSSNQNQTLCDCFV